MAMASYLEDISNEEKLVYIHRWVLGYNDVPVQHMQAIQGQTESGYCDIMALSYNKWFGIFYMHNQIHTKSHGTAFVASAGSFSWTGG